MMSESELRSKSATAAERLEVVGELASLINTTFDLDEIFPAAIQKIGRVLEFRRASVVLVSEDRASFYLHTLYDEQGGGFLREASKHYPVDRGLTGKVIKTGKAILIDDFSGTSGIRTPGESGVSALIVPLRVSSEVIGTLNLGAAETTRYTEADLELAELLGRQIETSLHYSNLLATIQQQGEALASEHAQVESERSRLEALIESSDAAILMVADNKVAHANHAMADLLVLPREVLAGASMEMIERILTRSLANPAELAAQTAALRSGDAQLRDRVEFEFPHKRVCQRTVAPVKNEAGEVLGHVVMYRDVTREAEAEAAKSEFVSIVSHELRTPLTSVKASLGLLTKGAAGEVSQEGSALLVMALRNLERLIRLVDDLLDLSRIESGNVVGTLAPTSLADSLARAVEAVSDFARDRGIEIVCALPDDGLRVMADSDRLQQVLVNLLSNAVKFSSDGERVKLSWMNEERATLVRIEDRGPGIPEDQLVAIFDKFKQLERSATRKHGGAGLGLAISRMIVEGFGGEMWAESQLGEGSTFFVRLRLAPDSVGAERVRTGDEEPRSVLVLERKVSQRQRLVRRFEQEGWTVQTETRGQAGLRKAADWKPDLISVGVELEDMHGLDFLQQLRQEPATVDLTALMVGGGGGGHAVAYGADGWIPDDPHALVIEANRLAERPTRRIVLLIEDDPAVRVGLSRWLRRAGYACLEAGSGEAGLRLARQRKPDIVVTDWRIPGKDGGQLLREMRAEPELASVPAIVVTGYVDGAAEQTVEALGAELLHKPFSPSAVVREIDRLIGEREKRPEPAGA